MTSIRQRLANPRCFEPSPPALEDRSAHRRDRPIPNSADSKGSTPSRGVSRDRCHRAIGRRSIANSKGSGAAAKHHGIEHAARSALRSAATDCARYTSNGRHRQLTRRSTAVDEEQVPPRILPEITEEQRSERARQRSWRRSARIPPRSVSSDDKNALHAISTTI